MSAGFHSVEVLGTPRPKGSPRPIKLPDGRVILTVKSKACDAWEKRIKLALHHHKPPAPIDGPVAVALRFAFVRPKSVSRKRRWPHVRPDLDKLVRAVLDALEAGGMLAEDSRVVSLSAAKVYGDRPGVRVRVRELGAARQQSLEVL